MQLDQLSAHDRRRLAVEAYVDPRTLRSYIEGRAQSTSAARIEKALDRHLRREQGVEGLRP